MLCPSFVFAQVRGMSVLFGEGFAPLTPVVYFILGVLGIMLLCELLGMRFIPNSRIGLVEKLWSPSGSVSEGQIMALGGEAGFQADLLRGGLHFGLWRWQYRIHKVSLVTVPQGKIGYIYARDGEPLTQARRSRASQTATTSRMPVPSSTKADRPVRGQRGRQRAILREGMYAINLALLRCHHRRRCLPTRLERASAISKSWSHGRRRSDAWTGSSPRNRRLGADGRCQVRR